MQINREHVFLEIYNALYAEMYRFVGCLEPDRTNVQERVETIFLHVHRNLKHYQGECSYQVWVYGLAHSIMNSPWQRFRLRGRQGAVEAPRGPDLGLEPEEIAQTHSHEHEEDAEKRRRVQMDEVRRIFQELSPRDREVVWLHSVCLFSHSDLALILGIGEGSARTRIEETLGWTNRIEVTAREWVADVLESFRHEPTDLELLEKKAESLQRIEQRIKHRKLRTTIVPIAAVAVGAVAGLILFLWPGELREDAKTVASAPAPLPAELIEIDLGEIPSDWPETYLLHWRSEAYRNQGYQMLYTYEGRDVIADAKGMFVVTYREGHSKWEKKFLLDLSKSTSPRIQAVHQSYLLISTERNSELGVQESMMMVDLSAQTLTPIPTGSKRIVSITVWEHPSPVVVYCVTEEAQNKTIFIAYDVRTGQEEVLHESPIAGGASFVTAEGGALVINAHNSIYLIDDKGKRLIAHEDDQELSAFAVRDGEWVQYISGRRMVGNHPRNHYTGRTKVMGYQIATGKSEPLIGDVAGDQYLLGPWVRGGSRLIGNFVPESGAALSEEEKARPDLPGTSQIWHLDPKGNVKLLYEHKTVWSQHWLEMGGIAGLEGQHIFLVSQNQEWALYIDMASGTAKKITQQEMKEMREKMSAS